MSMGLTRLGLVFLIKSYLPNQNCMTMKRFNHVRNALYPAKYKTKQNKTNHKGKNVNIFKHEKMKIYHDITFCLW